MATLTTKGRCHRHRAVGWAWGVGRGGVGWECSAYVGLLGRRRERSTDAAGEWGEEEKRTGFVAMKLSPTPC